MARTEVRSAQIKDNEVKRVDLNTTENGQAVITKLLLTAGSSGATISSTGADSGTGDVTLDLSTLTGGGGGVTTVATIDSQSKSNNGLVIVGSNIVAQTADATFPGLVSNTGQTFSGQKTFSSAPVFSSVTVSQPLKLNGSGTVISGLISLTTEISGILPITNGGSGQSTQQSAIDALTNVSSATTNQILTKDGSGNATFQTPLGNFKTEGSVQTTDATETTINTITIPDDTNVVVDILVSAEGPAGKHYWAKISGSARREGAGSASLVGIPFTVSDDEGSPTYSAKLDISGNDIRVRITGASAETVDWKTRVVALNA